MNNYQEEQLENIRRVAERGKSIAEEYSPKCLDGYVEDIKSNET